MALVDLKTDLKTLKYSQFGPAAPLVQKDHLKAGNYNALSREITARTDDVLRLTKYLARNPKFLLNQTLLRTSLKKGELNRDQLGNALKGAAGERLSLLGQAAISGTGIRLIHETDLIRKSSENNGYYIGESGAKNGALTTGLIKIVSSKRPSALENRLQLSREVNKDPINSTTIYQFTTEELKDLEDKQIIPFRIDIINPEDTTNTQTEHLFFRAYLTSLNDNYDSDWNAVNYVGRAESLYTYNSFSRNVNFGFLLAADRKDELGPLYKKLNKLVGITSPSYNQGLSFYRGIFTKLTIGDYFSQIPGFFSNFSLTWNSNFPWEIGINEEGVKESKEIPRVPHLLSVEATFTPIHNFIPRYGQEYIGTQNLSRI